MSQSSPVNISSFQLYESLGSPRISYNRGNTTATREFRIAYADANSFVGYLFSLEPTDSDRIIRVPDSNGASYPNQNGVNSFWSYIPAVSAEIEPWAQGNDKNVVAGTGGNLAVAKPSYTWARVTLTYAAYPVGDIDVSMGMQMRSVNADWYAFPSGTSAAAYYPKGIELSDPVMDVSISFYQSQIGGSEVQEITTDNLLSRVGKINSDQVIIESSLEGFNPQVTQGANTFLFGAETLKFVGCDIMHENFYEHVLEKYTLHFKWRQESWNKLYNADESIRAWQEMTPKICGDPIVFNGKVIPVAARKGKPVV